MLKKILKILFDEHVYEKGSELHTKIASNFHLSRKKNIYFSTYYSNMFKDMIYELKYRRKKYIAKVLADLIKEDVEYIVNKHLIDYVIPVPISNERLKIRGFNQVSLIFENFDINLLEIKKRNNTIKMSKLKHNYERKLNILNSFDVGKYDLNDTNLLIVDDILTSGATIDELAKELKRVYTNVNIYVYVVAISSKYVRRIDE